MYRIIPFRKEHLACMEIREHESHLISDETLEGLEHSVAITGIVDGRIISCGGIIPYHHGNAEIWQIPSIYVQSVTLEYARFVRKWIEEQQRLFCLHRMETLCLDDELHNRWMRFLGFQKEGTKRKWVNDMDYCLWGRLFNGD
jgi:hypothetical protein